MDRQNEVIDLSEKCDAVVVIGDKLSSNSKRLADVAAKCCKNVFFVQNASELGPEMDKFAVVGVTAGASTPACIIKEVVNMLEEKEMNFEEAIESTLKPLNTGDIVKGTVIKITPTEVYVGLDAKADGIIPADQVTIKPNVNIADILSVGQEIEADLRNFRFRRRVHQRLYRGGGFRLALFFQHFGHRFADHGQQLLIRVGRQIFLDLVLRHRFGTVLGQDHRLDLFARRQVLYALLHVGV